MNCCRPLVFATALSLATATASAQEVLHEFVGSTADSYGQVCNLVGDMNGDGLAEMLVGAWRDDNGALSDAGSCMIYDGATGAPLPTIFGTGAGDHTGYGSSSAGDANGDGYFDVCAAGDEADITGIGNNVGEFLLVSGFDGSVIRTVEGEDANDLFGWSTACAGDVNGDGFDDVVCGALNAEGGSSPSNAGSVTVVSGFDGSAIHTVYGTVANGSLGSNVGRAGDVNDDGLADFIAARGTRAFVFSGLDGSILWDLDIGGSGGKVSGGIDANLDGYDNLVTGSSTGAGTLRVHSGFDGSILWDLAGATGDRLGASVLGAGDLNGDGYGNFVAGATNDDDGILNGGAVIAFSGKDGSQIGAVYGTIASQSLGHALGGLHDVNGDGINDVVASSVNRARASVVSFVPEGIEIFGTGTPGCDGPMDIGANGRPTSGNSGFRVNASNAPANTVAVMGLSDAADPTGTVALGVLLHIALPPTANLYRLLVTPPADSNGSLSMPLNLPSNPNLIGRTFTVQVAGLWGAGSPCGVFSTSRGMSLTILP